MVMKILVSNIFMRVLCRLEIEFCLKVIIIVVVYRNSEKWVLLGVIFMRLDVKLFSILVKYIIGIYLFFMRIL